MPMTDPARPLATLHVGESAYATGGFVTTTTTSLPLTYTSGTNLAPAATDRAPRGRAGDRLHAFRRQDRQPLKAELPVVKEGSGATTAVVRLYDVIDSYGEWWGISAKEFATVLDGLPDTITEIKLLINSPGGEVTEGIAILNLLRNHDARVVGIVEGLAASAASFIAAGCDELYMNPNAEFLVHDAWGLCVGNAADMVELAGILDHLSDNIASIYAAKAGGTVADWRAVMATDTWYSADEAVAAGLADSVTTPAPDAKPSARVDRSIFARHTGPKNPADHPAVGSSATTEGGPAVAFSDEQYTNLREKLGVDADADEGSILAAVDSLLEQATAPPAPVADTDPAPLPEGVVAISEAQLAELRANAQAGVQAREAQITAERESLVFAAVSDGRISPAERDAWLAKLETGTGAESVLASLKPGLIPVDSIGSGGAADLDAEFADYVAIYGKES